jgi:hypothetical protein
LPATINDAKINTSASYLHKIPFLKNYLMTKLTLAYVDHGLEIRVGLGQKRKQVHVFWAFGK